MFGQLHTFINYAKLMEIQKQQGSYRLTKSEITKKQHYKTSRPKVKNIH